MISDLRKLLPGIILGHEEQELYKIAVKEYDLIFPNIIIYTNNNSFILSLERYIQIALIPLGKKYSPKAMENTMNKIKNKVYNPEIKKIKDLLSTFSENKTIFQEEYFIPHCTGSKDTIHSCGNKMYILGDEYIYCKQCEMIYKPNFILFKCKKCGTSYYTAIEREEENKQMYREATYESYHCDSKINDVIKCPKCMKCLYINQRSQKICCLNCGTQNREFKTKCLKCGVEFNTKGKVYNPLEFNTVKIAMREANCMQKEARPPFLPCGHIKTEDIKNQKFYHKSECDGVLYETELDGKKIVVCVKCSKIYDYNQHLWYCPVCKGRFTINDNTKQENPSNSIQKSQIKIISLNSQKTNESFKHPMRRQSKECNIINSDAELSRRIKREKSNDSKRVIPIRLPPHKRLNSPSQVSNYYLGSMTTKSSSGRIEPFNSEEYEIRTQIGKGTYGTIYVVTKNKKDYAMKKLLACSMEEVEELRKEFDMVSNLFDNDRLCLTKIYGIEVKAYDSTTYGLNVLMDLAIRDWSGEIEMRKRTNNFYSEDELIKILKNLVYTFAELQKRNITHRDIKPQNILVFKDFSLKIADFGEAKEILGKKADSDTYKQTLKGTELFMSPALFKHYQSYLAGQFRNKYQAEHVMHNTYKSDVFSLGLCFLYAATLEINSLFAVRECYNRIQMESYAQKFFNKKKYSSMFTDLIFDMIEPEEKDRKDFIELNKYLQGH